MNKARSDAEKQEKDKESPRREKKRGGMICICLGKAKNAWNDQQFYMRYSDRCGCLRGVERRELER